MSRWGNTATFYYAAGDTLSSGTYIYLDASQMPQYPVACSSVTDRTSYRSKGGTLWAYQNYNLKQYEFNWSLLDEGCVGSLQRMYDSNPILTFSSNGTVLGTFRIEGDYQSEEVQYELYDVSFTLVERG